MNEKLDATVALSDSTELTRRQRYSADVKRTDGGDWWTRLSKATDSDTKLERSLPSENSFTDNNY